MLGVALWGLVLLGAILAANWGADQLSVPLQKLRRQWGLSEAAGAAFVALATASPEIGTNTASALKGLADIGLGNLLGSNIISVPVIVLVAYIANRTRSSEEDASADKALGDSQRDGQFGVAAPPSTRHLLRLKREALTVQAIPYMVVIAIAALLTLPPPWRGLQPIDGVIMLVVYAVYLAQAILRQRQQGQAVHWTQEEIWCSVAGVLALTIGAYFTVTATENIVSIVGISELIGGLFITSTLSIAPEVFATWSVARSGQVTAATTSVIADNTATMSLALVPLAFASLPIQDLPMFLVNLGFVALFGVAYGALVKWGDDEDKYSFELWEVGLLVGLYLVYLAVIIVGFLLPGAA
ncbi:MAG: sodium:calcium exchanger [Cyanobacteria bacterium P01_A01_bin.135]